jgi:hypothetical protein
MVTVEDYNSIIAPFGIITDPQITIDGIIALDGPPTRKSIPVVGHDRQGFAIYKHTRITINNLKQSGITNQAANIRADPMVTVEDYNSNIASYGVFTDPQITIDGIIALGGISAQKSIPVVGHNRCGFAIYSHPGVTVRNLKQHGIPKKPQPVVSYLNAVTVFKQDQPISKGVFAEVKKLSLLLENCRKCLQREEKKSEIPFYKKLVSFLTSNSYPKRAHTTPFSILETKYAICLISKLSLSPSDAGSVVVDDVLHYLHRTNDAESQLAVSDIIQSSGGSNDIDNKDTITLALRFLEEIISDKDKQKVLSYEWTKDSGLTRRESQFIRTELLQGIHCFSSLGLRSMDISLIIKKITENDKKLTIGYNLLYQHYIAITTIQLNDILSTGHNLISSLDLKIDIDPISLFERSAKATTNLETIDSLQSIITPTLYNYLIQLAQISEYNKEIQDCSFNRLISNILYTKEDLIIHVIRRGSIKNIQDATENNIKTDLLYLFYDLLAWDSCTIVPRPEYL